MTDKTLSADPLAAAEAGRLWRVNKPLSDGKIETELVEADIAAPWPNSVLYFWNRGASKAQEDRRLVLALAAGEWLRCEPVR